MALEIERKFIVKGHWNFSSPEQRVFGSEKIVQGYLVFGDPVEVRIRIIQNEIAQIANKIRLSERSRFEFSHEIDFSLAQNLLAECKHVIDKDRYGVVCHYKGRTFKWEVDVYFGGNAGLVIAEIELDQEKEEITLPHWLGKEITGDSRLSNSSLSRLNWRDWNAQDREAILENSNE